LKKYSPKMNPDSSQVDYNVQAEQSKSISKIVSEERKKRIKERAKIIEKNTLKKFPDENLDEKNP